MYELGALRRVATGLTLAGLLTFGVVGVASADTSAAGNGGTSSAGANGGAVSTGIVDSGESSGSLLGASIAEQVIAAILGEVSVEEE